ncbi:MAG: DEAD/DEAH box helicase [Campylobacterales bacterium]|nr:DEAD/DEAH box helicase [Campylobacterales bacterium]
MSLSTQDNLLTILKHNHLFLTGGGGVGKSYNGKKIISTYQNAGQNVIIVASTGIAAVSIGGQTIHSLFGFGLCSNLEQLYTFDNKNRRLKEIIKLIEATDLIVVDEVSMVSGDLLDMFYYRLEQSNFKGRVLFVGDFYQLPPVVKNTNQNNSLFSAGIYAYESQGWRELNPVVVELTKLYRTENEEFGHILNRVRMGDNSSDVISYLTNLSNNSHVLQSDPVTLFGTNNEANMQNLQRLQALQTPEKTFEAVTRIEDGKLHAKKFETWKNNLSVEENLTIKIGVPVIFTVNKYGLFYNGERGIVTGFDDDVVFIETDKREVKLERHEFVMGEYVLNGSEVEEKTLAKFSQFPIRIAYAITIHKSQGMGIENLVCNVNNIFTDSQFYVAISRGIDPEKLFLQFTRGDLAFYLQKAIRISPSVKNFYENTEIVTL